MQAMARALTTAADPAQVADAVFAALRDELHVDAATFALLNERGQLHTLRRFGYGPESRSDGVLSTLQPDGPVLGHTVAVFAESLEDLRRQRSDLFASLASTRFRALAVIPLVVSDRTIGAVVMHWGDDRGISEPGPRLSLDDHRGGCPGRRAGPPDPDRIRQPRANRAPASTEFGPRRCHHTRRRRPCRDRRGSASARRAVSRRAHPLADERSLSCLASSGHPAVLARGMVPIEGSRAGACISRGLTEIVHIAAGQTGGRRVGRDRYRDDGTGKPAGASSELAPDVEVEVVRRALAELPSR